ncbi:unnamed protein product, partial [marine sediment metagenome]
DPNWKEGYHRNREALLTPEELEKFRQLEKNRRYRRSINSIA